MLHKKLILSLAAVLAIGAGGSMATFGGFVGSANATHNFSAGKIVPTLSVTDSNGHPFNISNMVPDDVANGNINIHNAGPTAFKYETITITRSDPNSVLDHAIWVNSAKLGISNWGLNAVEGHGAWENDEHVGSGDNATIPFSFTMVPTNNLGYKPGQNGTPTDIDSSNPSPLLANLQGAKQTLTFTVKAYQRDGTVRTFQDSVDI
jgi:hypothetical protein